LTGALDTALVLQVQSTASTVCGFLPTVETVTGIIGTITGTGPSVATANSIAAAICRAVTAKSARSGAVAPRVNGVTIRGRFVR
jgi:hypothetical protein